LAIIVGARPQFIKIAPLVREIEKSSINYYVIHTGQHYDVEMSDIFFSELKLPKPDINLEIGSGSHGEQTGRMLAAIEEELVRVKPDLTLVPGDTNSTLAGALASVKLKIPVAHLEAGVRSNDFYMPEEINRRVVDQVSELLFAPTENAVKNLLSEGIARGRIHQTGDIMYDALLQNIPIAREKTRALKELGVNLGEKYAVLTLHREKNVDNAGTLESLLEALPRINAQIVFPIHPRTEKNIERFRLKELVDNISNLTLAPSLGYLEFLSLLNHCSLVLTDSGGVQKEAFLLKKPCITMRESTEWIETVKLGANVLVGTNAEKLVEEANRKLEQKTRVEWGENPFGNGKASEKIVNILEKYSSPKQINRCVNLPR
jgi:UDP-GlcNAc3NAcA epimerase